MLGLLFCAALLCVVSFLQSTHLGREGEREMSVWGGIEKSVPRIAVWQHEACRVVTNGDPEGRIFLSYPHTNNGFLFLLPLFLFIYLFYLFI